MVMSGYIRIISQESVWSHRRKKDDGRNLSIQFPWNFKITTCLDGCHVMYKKTSEYEYLLIQYKSWILNQNAENIYF